MRMTWRCACDTQTRTDPGCWFVWFQMHAWQIFYHLDICKNVFICASAFGAWTGHISTWLTQKQRFLYVYKSFSMAWYDTIRWLNHILTRNSPFFMRVNTYTYIYVHVYWHMLCIYTYLVHVCTFIHTLCIHICACKCIHAYTYTYAEHIKQHVACNKWEEHVWHACVYTSMMHVATGILTLRVPSSIYVHIYN